MHLIILYGPPGVGKLTTGKELVKLTGYSLFHNQLTFDLVYEVMPRKHPDFWKTVTKLRLDMLKLATKSGLKGMIITFCFSTHPEDLPYMKNVQTIVEKSGGKCSFVQLTCAQKEHHKRLLDPSRKRFKKLRSVKDLKKMQAEHDMTVLIPGVKNLVIDSTRRSAKSTAAEIITLLKFKK